MLNKTRLRQIRMKRAIAKIQPPEVIQAIYLHLKEFIQTERDRPKLEIAINKKNKLLIVTDKVTRYVVIHIWYLINPYRVVIRRRADLSLTDCDDFQQLAALRTLDITDPQLIEKLEQAITDWK